MTSTVDRFGVECHGEGSEASVRVVGEVDMATAGVLAAELDRAIEGSTGGVTLNLAGVTFMDSTGLYALLRARAALAALSRSLVVAEPGRATTRLFELAGLVDTFELAVEPS